MASLFFLLLHLSVEVGTFLAFAVDVIPLLNQRWFVLSHLQDHSSVVTVIHTGIFRSLVHH